MAAPRDGWRRTMRAVALAALVLGAPAPGLVAEEPVQGPPDAVLAKALEVLKSRLDGKRLEAELLAKAGKDAEALELVRGMDRIYREGLAELERIVKGAGAPQPPAQAPAGDALDDGPAAGPSAAAWKGRGGQKPTPTRPATQRYESLLRALRWLAAHQSAGGAWEAAGFREWCDGQPAQDPRPDGAGNPNHDVGVTGLALSAFLGAGYTHRGEHEFAGAIRRGLNYLRGVQDEEGCFGERRVQHYIYHHACAALAMVEAYGMSGSSGLKASAQKAIDFILKARNPNAGWRYGVQPGDNDTSVTGWMVMVLKSAQLINQHAVKGGGAAPLRLDDEAFRGARRWFDRVTDEGAGSAGYLSARGGAGRPQSGVARWPAEKTESTTAIAMLARIFMGADPRSDPLIKRAADRCAELPPKWNTEDGSLDMYFWYYATLALFQVGGDRWTEWDTSLRRALLPKQRDDDTYCGLKGSWDPLDPWGADGGRVYSTAMVALCLEAEYRYERLFPAR